MELLISSIVSRCLLKKSMACSQIFCEQILTVQLQQLMWLLSQNAKLKVITLLSVCLDVRKCNCWPEVALELRNYSSETLDGILFVSKR